MGTHFKGPVFSSAFIGGSPGSISIPSGNSATPGKVLFVDAGNSEASDGNDGTSPDKPKLTIQNAIDACTDGAGDTVFVFAFSYDENVVIEEKDYVTIIGATLAGYARPDIVPAAGAALTVTASQGVVCKHVRFVSTDAACVKNEGNGFIFEDCVFDEDGTATIGLHLKGNADDDSFTASEGVIRDCLFRGPAAGIVFDTGDAPDNGVGCTDVTVSGCKFIGCTQDIVTADSGGGAHSVQGALIVGCLFADKNKTNYIDFTTANGGDASAQTGMIAGCYFATDSITDTNVAMVGTGFTLVGCYDTVGIEDGSDQDD